MQNMQFPEFPHLLGHFSGSAVIWGVFREERHHTAISGINLWRGVLSRAGVGAALPFFKSVLRFGTSRSAILILYHF